MGTKSKSAAKKTVTVASKHKPVKFSPGTAHPAIATLLAEADQYEARAKKLREAAEVLSS